MKTFRWYKLPHSDELLSPFSHIRLHRHRHLHLLLRPIQSLRWTAMQKEEILPRPLFSWFPPHFVERMSGFPSCNTRPELLLSTPLADSLETMGGFWSLLSISSTKKNVSNLIKILQSIVTNDHVIVNKCKWRLTRRHAIRKPQEIRVSCSKMKLLRKMNENFLIHR